MYDYFLNLIRCIYDIFNFISLNLIDDKKGSEIEAFFRNVTIILVAYFLLVFYACAIFLTCQDRQVMKIEYVAINVLIITISKVFSLYLIDPLLKT